MYATSHRYRRAPPGTNGAAHEGPRREVRVNEGVVLTTLLKPRQSACGSEVLVLGSLTSLDAERWANGTVQFHIGGQKANDTARRLGIVRGGLNFDVRERRSDRLEFVW
jgi:hypothetical protein